MRPTLPEMIDDVGKSAGQFSPPGDPIAASEAARDEGLAYLQQWLVARHPQLRTTIERLPENPIFRYILYEMRARLRSSSRSVGARLWMAEPSRVLLERETRRNIREIIETTAISTTEILEALLCITLTRGFLFVGMLPPSERRSWEVSPRWHARLFGVSHYLRGIVGGIIGALVGIAVTGGLRRSVEVLALKWKRLLATDQWIYFDWLDFFAWIVSNPLIILVSGIVGGIVLANRCFRRTLRHRQWVYRGVVFLPWFGGQLPGWVNRSLVTLPEIVGVVLGLALAANVGIVAAVFYNSETYRALGLSRPVAIAIVVSMMLVMVWVGVLLVLAYVTRESGQYRQHIDRAVEHWRGSLRLEVSSIYSPGPRKQVAPPPSGSALP